MTQKIQIIDQANNNNSEKIQLLGNSKEGAKFPFDDILSPNLTALKSARLEPELKQLNMFKNQLRDEAGKSQPLKAKPILKRSQDALQPSTENVLKTDEALVQEQLDETQRQLDKVIEHLAKSDDATLLEAAKKVLPSTDGIDDLSRNELLKRIRQVAEASIKSVKLAKAQPEVAPLTAEAQKNLEPDPSSSKAETRTDLTREEGQAVQAAPDPRPGLQAQEAFEGPKLDTPRVMSPRQQDLDPQLRLETQKHEMLDKAAHGAPPVTPGKHLTTEVQIPAQKSDHAEQQLAANRGTPAQETPGAVVPSKPQLNLGNPEAAARTQMSAAETDGLPRPPVRTEATTHNQYEPDSRSLGSETSRTSQPLSRAAETPLNQHEPSSRRLEPEQQVAPPKLAGTPAVSQPEVKPGTTPALNTEPKTLEKNTEQAFDAKRPEKMPEQALDAKRPEKMPEQALEAKRPEKMPEQALDAKRPEKMPEQAAEMVKTAASTTATFASHKTDETSTPKPAQDLGLSEAANPKDMPLQHLEGGQKSRPVTGANAVPGTKIKTDAMQNVEIAGRKDSLPDQSAHKADLRQAVLSKIESVHQELKSEPLPKDQAKPVDLQTQVREETLKVASGSDSLKTAAVQVSNLVQSKTEKSDMDKRREHFELATSKRTTNSNPLSSTKRVVQTDRLDPQAAAQRHQQVDAANAYEMDEELDALKHELKNRIEFLKKAQENFSNVQDHTMNNALHRGLSARVPGAAGFIPADARFPSPRVNPPVFSKNFAADLIQKIEDAQNLQSRGLASSTTTVVVQAGLMGELDIEFHQEAGKEQITVFVENETARTDLNRVLPQIEDNLHQKGFTFTGLEVEIRNANKDNHFQSEARKMSERELDKLGSEEATDEGNDTIEKTDNRKYGYNTMEVLA